MSRQESIFLTLFIAVRSTSCAVSTGRPISFRRIAVLTLRAAFDGWAAARAEDAAASVVTVHAAERARLRALVR